MTQKEQLLALFKENGGKITLGQILYTTLAAEYRARMTDLRREGYRIDCIKGKRPMDNLYILGEAHNDSGIVASVVTPKPSLFFDDKGNSVFNFGDLEGR